MSRPSESVPSQCSGDGGRSREPSSCASGSYGAMSGAKAANSANVAISAIAATLSGFARIGARATRRRPRTGSATALATLRPRVEPEIRDVDHQIRERVDDRREQGDAEHRREVQRHRRCRRITAQTRPAEDRLGEHGAREKAPESQPDDRDGRNERVAQPVAKDHESLLKALGARGPHVVLAEDLEHARAGHSRNHRGREIAEREGGQHEMEKAAAECNEIAGEQAVDDEEARPRRWRGNEVVDAGTARKPAELVVEETDHDEAEPEDRNRTADQRPQPYEMVGKPAARNRGPDTRRNADEDRDDESGQRELDGGRERIEQVVGDRTAGPDASTEIAVREADNVREVLLGKRPVEVVLRPECRDLLIRRVVSERRRDRIGWDDVRDREGDDRDADHHRRDSDDPPGQEPEEPHGALRLLLSY